MADAQAPEGKKLDVKKMMGIVFIVINLVVVGGGAFLVYAGTLGHKNPSISEAELSSEINKLREELQTTPVTYGMEAFNTNLDGLPRRFIRLEMSVEMYDQEGFEELVTMGGESRDEIMRVVNSKRLQDVDHIQGKLNLKSEIASKLNTLMHRGVVKNVYFTKFQVQ